MDRAGDGAGDDDLVGSGGHGCLQGPRGWKGSGSAGIRGKAQAALERQKLPAEACGEEAPDAFFFSSRRRHTSSVSAFLLNRSSDLSALAGGAMSKLFGGGQKAASGGIQGDVLATDNNTVGMGDAGIKSAIQGSNVPNPDEAVPSFVSGAMAKAGKGLLEGTLQA